MSACNGSRMRKDDKRSCRSLWCQAATAIGLSLTSAVLLTLTFPPYEHEWLAWFGLIPLLVLARCQFSLWLICLASYFGGVLFHFVSIDWMRTSVAPSANEGVRWLGCSIIALILGTSWPISVSLANSIPSRPSFIGLSWAMAWTVGEYARFYISALVDETGFPWLQLAHTQYRHVLLLQAASIAGAWLITFFIAFINGELLSIAAQLRSVWQAKSTLKHLVPNVLIIVVFATAMLGYGAWTLKNGGVLNGPQIWLMPARHSVEEELSMLAASPDVNGGIAIWPESAYDRAFGDANGPKRDPLLNRIEETSVRNDVVLLCSGSRCESVNGQARMYSSVAVVDSQRGFGGWYDKVALVPYSEFRPWFCATANRWKII